MLSADDVAQASSLGGRKIISCGIWERLRGKIEQREVGQTMRDFIWIHRDIFRCAICFKAAAKNLAGRARDNGVALRHVELQHFERPLRENQGACADRWNGLVREECCEACDVAMLFVESGHGAVIFEAEVKRATLCVCESHNDVDDIAVGQAVLVALEFNRHRFFRRKRAHGKTPLSFLMSF